MPNQQKLTPPVLLLGILPAGVALKRLVEIEYNKKKYLAEIHLTTMTKIIGNEMRSSHNSNHMV